MTGYPSAPDGTPRPDGFGTAPNLGGSPRPAAPQATRRPSRRKAWLTHGLTAVVALIIGAAIGGSGQSETDGDDARPADTTAATSPAVVTTPMESATTPAPAQIIATTPPAPPVVAPATVTASTPTPPAETGPARSIQGEGQYLVGEEMEAGTYKTAGPAGGVFPNCYWARLKDASGEFGAIVANGNVQGPTRVTVRKGEYFETNGCQTWERVG